MSMDKISYRYFGIELRIVFYLTALVFLLLSIVSFKHSFFLSLFSFLIFILIALLTYLDFNNHLLTLDQEGLSFSRLFTKNKSKEKGLYWKSIQKISTQEFGIFKLLKTTRIISEGKVKIRVFSFMEDYYHFLKDLCEKSKNAEIDKLTQNLLAGQADF